ncbi:ATP-dependent acyl-CoA ligase [Novosphingobium sp. 1949]|uniref:ATP-dependent acyl-CoA ligase n=2 Tax=Novosphingobium organovorum TaxID=2930092 RepID=A0ABT0BBL6_9SPHN|nr:ATP-dependent acyl-CoA ligase [Novosphingobium organovorum]
MLVPPIDRRASKLLEIRARESAPTTLLRMAGQDYSAADLIERASRLAHSMREQGVGPGDRVAILCGNRIEMMDLILACSWLNAVAVPINLASRGAQLQHILGNCGARLLAIESALASILDFIDAGAVAIEQVWLIGAEGEDGLVETVGPWPAAALPEGAGRVDPVECASSDTGAIIYTSGTTGPSKGVCCPHAQFYWWGVNSAEILEITQCDVLLTTLPLFHVNALGAFYQALVSGGMIVVLERFSARGFVPSLREHGATVTYVLGAMVPILLSTAAKDDDADHPTTRALAPGVPADSMKAFTERFGIGLIDGYGSTETNFVIGETLAHQKPGAMGRVRPGYHAMVADAQDDPVPTGEPGELLLRSDIAFSTATGYFEMPEATSESRRNLWFHTGDRVYQDAQGYFYFMDRIKDAIRRRGENISSYEVEQVLHGHPAIAVAAVYAVASELAEDEVMTAIVLHEGARVSPEEILDFCQPRMTYFSVPRFVRFCSKLPSTENGKVQKFKLREQGVTQDTWDREKVGYEVRRDVPRKHTA